MTNRELRKQIRELKAELAEVRATLESRQPQAVNLGFEPVSTIDPKLSEKLTARRRKEATPRRRCVSVGNGRFEWREPIGASSTLTPPNDRRS